MDYKNKPNTNLICALSGCYYSPLSSLERILKVGLWDSSPMHLSTVGGGERFALSTFLGSASCSAFRVRIASWFPLGIIEKTVTVLPSVGDGGLLEGASVPPPSREDKPAGYKGRGGGGGGDCSSSWMCSLKSKSRPTDPLLPLRCAFQQIIEIHAVQNTNSVLHIKEIDALGAKCKREKETL